MNIPIQLQMLSFFQIHQSYVKVINSRDFFDLIRALIHLISPLKYFFPLLVKIIFTK